MGRNLNLKKFMHILSACALTFLATALTALTAPAGENPYNEKADARAEIKQALTAAAAARIPVIVVFGANWCPDCRSLDLAMHRGATAQLLAGHFNPNSESKMAGMCQDVRAETLLKNRRHTRSGLVRLPLREARILKWATAWQWLGKPIFQSVYAQKIDADRPF